MARNSLLCADVPLRNYSLPLPSSSDDMLIGGDGGADAKVSGPHSRPKMPRNHINTSSSCRMFSR